MWNFDTLLKAGRGFNIDIEIRNKASKTEASAVQIVMPGLPVSASSSSSPSLLQTPSRERWLKRIIRHKYPAIWNCVWSASFYFSWVRFSISRVLIYEKSIGGCSNNYFKLEKIIVECVTESFNLSFRIVWVVSSPRQLPYNYVPFMQSGSIVPRTEPIITYTQCSFIT